VIWLNQDDGRTYKLKTNKKGEYYSVGIAPGAYTVTLVKDGKILATKKDFKVTVDEMILDFNQKSEQSQQQQTQHGPQLVGSPEQMKQIQEDAKTEKQNENIRAVNEKLKAGIAAANSGDYDHAIVLLQEAANIVPNEDLPWFDLGTVYLESAKKQSDTAEKTKRLNEAYDDVAKAISLKDAAAKNQPARNSAQGGSASAQVAINDPVLANYYDTLASAASQIGKNGEAAKAYKQSAELDPAHAGLRYLYLGLVLTNSNHNNDQEKRKQAVDALDKAIAADPSRADAYYLKGSNLIAMAKVGRDGSKMVAPEGTAEAFQKYLELQPNGPHAEEAKQMLAVLNSNMETSYGTPKKR
jgi:tetratricopeptide (TPR) repeat protein